jgi:hypothetical protein
LATGPGWGNQPVRAARADAQDEGYTLKAKAGTAERAPFHGYFFKILTRQTRTLPAASDDYIINGNMIGGFALVAWPADTASPA